jgi:hypothetical protein
MLYEAPEVPGQEKEPVQRVPHLFSRKGFSLWLAISFGGFFDQIKVRQPIRSKASLKFI